MEAPSTLWLLNFNLTIKCFVATPYSMGEQNFLNVEQIIPAQEAAEFMIGIADKSRDEVEGTPEEKNRHKVRREFWKALREALEGKTTRFDNVTPGPYGSFGAGSGVRGVWFNFGANRAFGRAEIYIDRGEGEVNKFIYDQFNAQKDAIEAAYGGELIWEPVVGERSCRIKEEKPGNIFVPEQWPAMIAFMADAMVRLENAFKGPLAAINSELHKRAKAEPVVAAEPALQAAAG